MKLPYERPEVQIVDFRAMERLASDSMSPELDLNPNPDISANIGVGDWNWPEN